MFSHPLAIRNSQVCVYLSGLEYQCMPEANGENKRVYVIYNELIATPTHWNTIPHHTTVSLPVTIRHLAL